MPCPGLPWTPPGMEAPPQIQVIPFPRCLKLVWPSFPSGEGHCERESALQASGIFQTHPYFQKLGYMTTALIPTPWLLLGIIFLWEWPHPWTWWGLSQEEAKEGESSGLKMFQFCSQPTDLVVIPASPGRNQRLVLPSLSFPSLRGFGVVTVV